MHSVRTILSYRPVDGFVDNHERYARGCGYRHAIVDGTHVYGGRQQVIHKTHAINAQLVAMEPGVLLLALVDDAARVWQGEQPRAMDGWRAAQQRTCEPARHLNPARRHRVRELAHVAHWRLRRCSRRELRSLLHATRLCVPRVSRPPAFLPAGVNANRAKIPRATQPLSCGDDARVGQAEPSASAEYAAARVANRGNRHSLK